MGLPNSWVHGDEDVLLSGSPRRLKHGSRPKPTAGNVVQDFQQSQPESSTINSKMVFGLLLHCYSYNSIICIMFLNTWFGGLMPLYRLEHESCSPSISSVCPGLHLFVRMPSASFSGVTHLGSALRGFRWKLVPKAALPCAEVSYR